MVQKKHFKEFIRTVVIEKMKKKSRARAPEKKAEQFNNILEAGKELFVKDGTHSFSMRALARNLDMSQTNLYNYVQSKRELWIAIRTKYFNEFQEGFNQIVNVYQGSYVDLWVKTSEFFLDFMSADYHRFQMMFLISAPPSKKIGPLEQAYEPFQLIQQNLKIVKQAINDKVIKETDTVELFYYIFGVVLGAAKVEADLKLNVKITEPITVGPKILSAKNFRKFVLKEIRERVEKIILS